MDGKALFDLDFYASSFFKINTKVRGLQPYKPMKYQLRFRQFVRELERARLPIRIIVVKCRQAGFTTEVAAYFTHKILTSTNYKALAMADEYSRTEAIRSIYTTFITELPVSVRPMISKMNTEEILLANPSPLAKNKGLNSQIVFETANDKNAGRSTTRKGVHWSETAFSANCIAIDEGIQNSVPLHPLTCIIKESTANGKSGTGRYFYESYNAAKRGDSLYKSFFVAWSEIDDYSIPITGSFELTEYETEMMKKYQGMLTLENLMWRRLKLMEYFNDESIQHLSPEERFKQDFPMDDVECFLSTGSPVFDHEKLNKRMAKLQTAYIDKELKNKLKVTSVVVKQFFKQLTIYLPPRTDKHYFIGADVALGLASGDSSSLFIMDSEYVQVATWHGKIDPDMFGHLLIGLGTYYNNALIVVEANNMGHTTVTTMKNNNYPNLYKKVVEDKLTKETSTRIGWTTSGPSKMDMLNEGIKNVRDDIVTIYDMRLLIDMGDVVRSENGDVELNGRDRVVAYCLAQIGRRQYSSQIRVSTPQNKLSKELYDTGPEKPKRDVKGFF